MAAAALAVYRHLQCDMFLLHWNEATHCSSCALGSGFGFYYAEKPEGDVPQDWPMMGTVPPFYEAFRPRPLCNFSH
jgi:hypothetical protein